MTLFFFSMYITSARAQYHYSQYFSSPLQINPAQTGYFDYGYRVSSVYRNQWGTDNNPFKTISASFDKRVLEDRMTNKLGIGIMASSDQSNYDAFSNNAIAFSSAYNMSVSSENNVELGVGLQMQYNQRRINPYSLTFASQFQSGGFNTSIVTPEMAIATTKSYMSVNAGMLLNIKSALGNGFYIGAALYNANSPTTNFLSQTFNDPIRWNFQAGGKIVINNTINLQLSSLISSQQGNNEMTFGGLVSMKVEETQESLKQLLLGSWYRLDDALIPFVGVQLNGFQIGMSYDFTASQLATASTVKNSFEVSLIYMSSNKKKNSGIPCYSF